MTDKLIDCFDQLSPLLDSAVNLMNAMHLRPSEHVALGFVACSELAIRSALSLPKCADDLTTEQRENILSLLAKKQFEAEEAMRAVNDIFVLGEKVQ